MTEPTQSVPDVTDTERVTRAKAQITRWIENLEYNLTQARSFSTRRELRVRIDDYQSSLALLDGREDASIVWLRTQ